MQNVIRRAQRTIRRADRRLQREKEVEAARDKRRYLTQLQDMQKTNMADIRAARKARVEDWNLGPLAPNRAIGRTAPKYGALVRTQLNPPFLPGRLKRNVWAIAQGDRVMIMKGIDKGKIGVVKEVLEDSDCLMVEGKNMAFVDGSLFDTGGGKAPPRRETEIPIAYDDVRLVTKWKDPRDGFRAKDVVVEKIELRPRGFERDPETGKRLYDRFIPGEGSEIPWPEKQIPEKQNFDSDTLRITVEENTFVPTLLYPPMPETVIDELRNPYSKFRTRHDDNYVQKMTAIDGSSEQKNELVAKMRTPLQEHRARQLEAKQKAPPKVLTDDMLARIGQVMAASRNAPKTALKVDRES